MLHVLNKLDIFIYYKPAIIVLIYYLSHYNIKYEYGYGYEYILEIGSRIWHIVMRASHTVDFTMNVVSDIDFECERCRSQ